MCLSSFPSIFYFRDHPFPSICSWLLCHLLNYHVYINWFLVLYSDLPNLHVHVYDNIILSKLHVYLVLFLSTSLCLQMLSGFYLNKLKVPRNVASVKSVCTIFSDAIFFMSVSYFSRSHNILSFLIYYYICYDLWS